MKKLLFMPALFVVICYSGCGLPTGPEGTAYRREVTVETNLSNLKINEHNLDSTTTYPYVLFDLLDNSGSTGAIVIYPVQDTGYIKLELFGGKSQTEQEPSISLKDSLYIYTPIDTTFINFREFQFIK